MKRARKVWKFLSSMRFAVCLLVLLAASCAAASLITQGQTSAWYLAHYSERTAGLILALQLDDAFHSWWFVLISVFLCVNLLLCNLVRFPGLYRRTRAEAGAPSPDSSAENEAEGVADPARVFAALRMPPPKRAETADGRELLYASKHLAGLWGAWVCHLGILLLIVGFALGQALRQEYTVYGVPGQSRRVGDTGCTVTIDDFRAAYYPDGSVEQYTTDLTVTPPEPDAAPRRASVSVNAPADLFGLTFYQNSTGWAAAVSVTESGEPLQETVLCAGEYLPIADKPELVVYFNAFYPDYALIPGSGPTTLSDQPNHPGYLYSVYYAGEILGMNVLTDGETLTIDDYEVIFSLPQRFTLIQVKRDAFTWLAFVGALLVTAGLFLAFYLQPVRVWAVREADGWRLRGQCRKGGTLFREAFARAVGADGNTERGPGTDGTPERAPDAEADTKETDD